VSTLEKRAGKTADTPAHAMPCLAEQPLLPTQLSNRPSPRLRGEAGEGKPVPRPQKTQTHARIRSLGVSGLLGILVEHHHGRVNIVHGGTLLGLLSLVLVMHVLLLLLLLPLLLLQTRLLLVR
jgi:hypothetical protein